MSTTLFPPLPAVGGIITQHVLKSLPEPNTLYTRHKVGGFSQTFSLNESKYETIDTAKYRHSFLHNLCLEMLQEGYHMAFRELFNLAKENVKEFASDKDNHESVQKTQNKLTFLKNQLIATEEAKRKGRSDQVYDAQLVLAKYFQELKDFDLSDHFFHASLQTSLHIRTDGRRKEADAYCNLGKAAHRRGEISEAGRLYEQFYSLTKGKQWIHEDGSLLHKKACKYLQHIYIMLAELVSTDDEEQVLNHLHKAHDVAKESGDTREIGVVKHLIGQKYDFYGDQETAVKYHTEYLELCKSIDDDEGIGKACQALAYANQRQGNMEMAAENLKTFLETSEKSGDRDSCRQACADLGALYISMGKYEQSSNYYKRAFELARKDEHQSPDVLDLSRCEYGVALAHGLLTGEVENIVKNKKSALDSLLFWKSERVQNFSKDERTYDMFETLDNRLKRTHLIPEVDENEQVRLSLEANADGEPGALL